MRIFVIIAFIPINYAPASRDYLQACAQLSTFRHLKLIMCPKPDFEMSGDSEESDTASVLWGWLWAVICGFGTI